MWQKGASLPGLETHLKSFGDQSTIFTPPQVQGLGDCLIKMLVVMEISAIIYLSPDSTLQVPHGWQTVMLLNSSTQTRFQDHLCGAEIHTKRKRL